MVRVIGSTTIILTFENNSGGSSSHKKMHESWPNVHRQFWEQNNNFMVVGVHVVIYHIQIQ